MAGDETAGAAIVDADQIEGGAVGIITYATVEQDYGDFGVMEEFDDGGVDGILFGETFEGSEEDAGNAALHVVGAELHGLVFLAFDFMMGRIPPEQGVVAGASGTGHALADGFEDFRFAEAGNEEAEEVFVALGLFEDVGTAAGAAFNEAQVLEFPEDALDGEAGDAVAGAQFSFSGQTFAGFVVAGANVLAQFLKDAFVFWLTGIRHFKSFSQTSRVDKTAFAIVCGGKV
jgi:hypothetical protein